MDDEEDNDGDGGDAIVEPVFTARTDPYLSAPPKDFDQQPASGTLLRRLWRLIKMTSNNGMVWTDAATYDG